MALLTKYKWKKPYKGLTKGTKVIIVDKANDDVDESYKLIGKVGTLDSWDEKNEVPDIVVFKDEAIALKDFIVEPYIPKPKKKSKAEKVMEEIMEFV